LKRFLDYVRTNQVVKVAKLLEKGLDSNFHSDLGETPLTIAVSLIEPREMIINLYNGGAHLDYRSRDSQTPIHKAAYLGNDKAINVLLELGAFPDVKDNKGLTPLFYAIINSSTIKCTELLLFNGSPLGIKDENNWQEIHHACKLGLSQHLDHLLYYGAEINAVNNTGNTALHICSVYNKENCARTLMFRGIDKTIRNLSNKTAYDSALIASNNAIADLIDKHRDADVGKLIVYRFSAFLSLSDQVHVSTFRIDHIRPVQIRSFKRFFLTKVNIKKGN
jgi:SH3/ankyrin repeat-containing protein